MATQLGEIEGEGVPLGIEDVDGNGAPLGIEDIDGNGALLGLEDVDGETEAAVKGASNESSAWLDATGAIWLLQPTENKTVPTIKADFIYPSTAI